MDEDEVGMPQLELDGLPEPVGDGLSPETGVGDPVEGVDYEVLGDNRYKWLDDGTVTDADGNVVQGEAESAHSEPEPDGAPTAPQAPTQTTGSGTERAATQGPTQASAQQPAVQPAPGQRQIYSRDATKDLIYSDEVLNQIAEIGYTDPVRAERMRADLNERYNQAVQSIDRYANQVFEQELDELAEAAPRAVQGLTRQIQRYKEQMTPEQRQQQGAARWAFNAAVAEAISRDPLVAEEIYVRATNHQNVPKGPNAPVPRKPAAPEKKIIPSEERMPGPGSARRVPQPRRPIEAGVDRSLAEYARFQKQLHPDWSEEECLDVARGAYNAQENARMRTNA